MKQLLITIAALMLVGCGESQESAPSSEATPVEPVAKAATPEPQTAKAPDIDIHTAAFDRDIEAVKQHLAAGTDVNAKGRNGSTPLHSAASGGHGGIVELLIAKGADVNANSNYKTPLYPYGKTPLDWANRLSRITAANLLRKHGGKTAEELENAEPVTEVAKVEPTTAKASDISLHDAVEKGKIEAVKQHLAAGTDVNAKDMYGDIPLHWAASRGHTEVAELLIANGADVNAKTDDDGRAALMLAALNGHKEIVELLIASGADVNALKDDGKTPLDEAIGYSHTETADLLRKHGGKTGEELKAEGK